MLALFRAPLAGAVSFRAVLVPLLLWGLLLDARPAYCQLETSNWYFGSGSGLSFRTGSPVVLISSIASNEACSAASDPRGNPLFYTNGETLWNRNDNVMATGLGGHQSATQGALIVPDPGSTDLFHVFALDAVEQSLVGGLRHTIVDMRLNGGLGNATAVKGVRMPTPTLSSPVTEKLAAIRHANGYDYWIVVHGWQSDAFYSFPLTEAGLGLTPVVSRVGTVHTSSATAGGVNNSIGYMRFSADGRRIAVAAENLPLELFDFDPATGVVANPVSLPLLPNSGGRAYGLEFSPDNSRLYVNSGFARRLFQYNLLAGSPTAILNSAQLLGSDDAQLGAMLLGPDNKIYMSVWGRNSLYVITAPNALGTACGYRPNSLPMGRTLMGGLPNFPNAYPVPALRITAADECEGTPVAFAATAAPLGRVGSVSWDFGDPGSGPANAATGLAATHVFSRAGQFQVTLSVVSPNGAGPFTTTRTVLVHARPVVQLGPKVQQVCQGETPTLSAAQPGGATYRWQSGFTGPAVTVTAPGTYRVSVTSPQGCSVQDSVRIEYVARPSVRLGPDTAMCQGTTLVLRPSAQPAGTQYRWPDGSTQPTLAVTVPGTYRVEVMRNGCSSYDEINVADAGCAVVVPNIITPNGDDQNEAFVLQGLHAPDWALRVFNRWGREVFSQAAYDNSWTAQGQPDGSYYYLLTKSASGQQLKGWLEVRR
ncbi:T9SS type B sorting domain-containing protein [Hymenobacter ruricola]|uniref:Gliding motility-associated C-terminal domain-containing protein n=1 Tax=Hymenobacter ruricola TaxID=2791023 RepID=A0ABS0I1L0_9BACT|nr:gliding motility-associated C-terminal domain-containing protein [Hymenobacter ruricola]MBF9220825.1 gliding motility-associated C-terminal domain-containing protein [Hymenobacter ruricola]